MRLKSLRLHGFKSFPDATQLDFHDGITAIVGPNGCGKSNIGDALRWVLGEQRPTAIRGVRMEEAIFQGTVARRPVNRGSVALVVSNEDGALATPFQEVEIGRTVFRDGGSDYRLNRSPCRLRDIVDLCRDTGLGANAYSLIEIRMIDAILSERTDERRALFEEAAGIGKYKDRRRSALRRLESSEADLQRVEDVIGEVRSKVRSLARQKGKAQRYRELRKRRLAVEIAVVKTDLEALDGRLADVDGELERDREQAAGMAARLAAAEARLEGARLAHVEAERTRSESAARLDALGVELARVEREVAVADERISNGKRRLAQISSEEAATVALRARSEGEIVTLRSEREECKAALRSCNADLTSRKDAAAEVRVRLDAARHDVRQLEARGRAVARDIARAEGDTDSARVQARELGHRFERLSADSREGAGALRDLRSQGDLFADRRTEMVRRAEDAARNVEGTRRRVAVLRERLRDARTAERSAKTRVASLEAEVAALRRMTGSGEDAAAVAESAKEALPGAVRGTLSDYVRVTGTPPRVVDDMLGRFGLALVVGGQEDVDRIAGWYEANPELGAGIVLLPMDGHPRPRGPLPSGVTAVGEGAPWAEALLGGVTVVADEVSVEAWTDQLGAVHLVPRQGFEGRLERRDRIDSLETEAALAAADFKKARESCKRLADECREREEEADAASERLLAARDEARAARAEASAQTDRRQQLARHQEEIARQLEGTRAARDKAVERSRTAAADTARLRTEEAALTASLEELYAVREAVEAEWEQARDAESEATIRAARLDSELKRLDGRLSDREATVGRAAARIDELGREARSLATGIEEVLATRQAGREALEALFGKRDELRRILSEESRALQEAADAVNDAGREARGIREHERAAVGRGHQLELERQDIRNRAGRIGERLEAEWGRPLAALLEEAEPAVGGEEALRDELEDIVRQLGTIGPVNMLAVEEHAEESARLDFLVRQQEDLNAARDDLRAAIRRINRAATELFMTTFEAIRENFRKTFEHLFNGGEANLWLTDPESPLESRVEIHAAPGGKRTQRIDLLSGGERALTALSLLFGIYLVKPSPFCLLDEVDAPLDESNIERFVRLLQGFKAQTQFVVITHNPRTIEAADWIYGVTMEEPGVSSIVGVRLQERGAVAPGIAG